MKGRGYIAKVGGWALMCAILMTGCDVGLSHPLPMSTVDSSVSFEDCVTQALADVPNGSALDSLMVTVLADVYARHDNLLWVRAGHPTAASLKSAQLLRRSWHYGLPPWWYHVPERFAGADSIFSEMSFQAQVLDDVLMSLHMMRFLLHVSKGVQSGHFAHRGDIDSLIVPELLSLAQSNHPIDIVKKLEPQSPFYLQMKSALPLFDVFFDHFLVCDHDVTELERNAVWRTLQTSGFYRSDVMGDDALFAMMLASWQKENRMLPSGELDFLSRKVLWELAMQNFMKVSLNMERIRQQPPHTRDYLWVNIPEFKLYACRSNRLVEQWKVIVGQPKTPTPVLSSSMSHVLTYPQWNIPPSIVVGEVLPDMRRDPLYLQKKGYVITNWRGEQLQPESVSIYSYSLNNHPYNIMQPPGSDNALGVLKFMFDNDKTVYLHDTNSRRLFERNYRALSHGCIRVNEPHRLAEYLLDRDSESIMYKQLAAKRSGYIRVKDTVGVYLRYLTCRVDDNGALILIPDIYHRDDHELQSLLSATE